jgi:hypothetical protein
LGRVLGSGTRPRLGTGQLGITVIGYAGQTLGRDPRHRTRRGVWDWLARHGGNDY